jgi:DNA-binding transcriptional regulator PaaX
MSLGSNQEKVNQTLRRMKDQELVSVRREGYAAFYSLSDKAKPVSVVRSDGASTHGLLSLDNANLLHSA